MTELVDETQPETEEEPVENGEEFDAEPGPEEEEEAETPEPQPEPQPDQPPTDMQLEAAAHAAEKRWTNYAKAVLGIYSETDAALYECPLCPTQHKGFVDMRFAGHVPEEVAEPITAYLMGGTEPDYPDAPNVARCTTCDGHGKVKTRSRVAGKTAIQCPRCKGYGYEPPPVPTEPGYAVTAELPTADHNGEGPLVEEERDIWNSPRRLPDGQDNPNYGKMPQYKDPSLP